MTAACYSAFCWHETFMPSHDSYLLFW